MKVLQMKVLEVKMSQMSRDSDQDVILHASDKSAHDGYSKDVAADLGMRCELRGKFIWSLDVPELTCEIYWCHPAVSEVT
jgi:hypothetical protein